MTAAACAGVALQITEQALLVVGVARHTCQQVGVTGQEREVEQFRLGVVSDAPRFQVWLRLCSLGLQHLFDAVVTFDDTGERKPAAAPFREVLRRLGVEPAESLMIGDWAERDVVGGKSLGMKTVFARYGDTFDTKESGADFDVDDVLDLVGIVDRLNGREPVVQAQGGGPHVR